MTEPLRIVGTELNATATRWQAISARLTAAAIPPSIAVRSQPSTGAATAIAACVAAATQRITARTENTADRLRRARVDFDSNETASSGQLHQVRRLIG